MTYYSTRGIPQDYKKVATAKWSHRIYIIYLRNDETMFGWLMDDSSDPFKSRSVIMPVPINQGFWKVIKPVLERILAEKDPSVSPNAHSKTPRKKVS